MGLDFRVLEESPAFRTYLAAETVSMVGTWMQVMAQAFVMTTLTSSAMALGLLNFASGIPTLLLTLKGGELADRLDKRRIVAVALVVQSALALALGALAAAGALAYWHLLAAASVAGVVVAFEMPAVAAMVPQLVPPARIGQAVTLDRATFHATRMVGPAAAGLLIGVGGAAAAFFVNAASFLPLLAIVPGLKLQHGEIEAAPDEAPEERGMGPAWRFIRGEPVLLSLLLLGAGVTFLAFPFITVLMPLYAKQVLGFGARGMGFLIGIAASGSLAATLGLLSIPRRLRARAVAVAAGGIALALGGLALLPPVPACAVLSLLCLTVSVSTLVGISNIAIQEKAPDALRGRISALAGLSFFGLMPFAGLGLPALADAIGMRPAIALAAVAFLGVAAFCLPRLRAAALS